MSDTPRTDKLFADLEDAGAVEATFTVGELFNLARQLERELQEARKALAGLHAASLKMSQAYNKSADEGISVAEMDRARQEVDEARKVAKAALSKG